MGKGIEVRPKSIRLKFTFEGVRYQPILKDGGEPLRPTPANQKHAVRLLAEIQSRIEHGTFSMADYFPASGVAGKARTVGDQLDLWLKTKAGLASSTLRGYRKAVRFWKEALALPGGSKDDPVTIALRALVLSDILLALAKRPLWSGKTHNNKVSVLRQALELAVLDKVLANNPCDAIEHSEHEFPEPDPFSVEEIELVLADMRKFYPPGVVRYFEFKFFTGLRTGESLSVKWSRIDWRESTVKVDCSIVEGEELKRTKTKTIRLVQLNSRSLAVLKAQKAETFLKGDLVFRDPVTDLRWPSDRRPRETYWVPCLKRVGLAYRSPYQTRHTYATMLLMGGTKAAWAADQMGHSRVVFDRIYARWLGGAANKVEIGKLEMFLTEQGNAALKAAI